MLPGVVVDMWRENKESGRYWATTPVDGIGFAVLERVYLELSENLHNMSHGDNSQQVPMQADLFGRHPSKGTLLMERVKSED